MKKILLFLFLGCLVCSITSANAQLKYESGKLRLNTDGYVVSRPDATTYFYGSEHAFAGNHGVVFSVRPIGGNGGGTVDIGTNTYYLRITHTGSGGFQDLYLANVYNYSDALAKTDVSPITGATGTVLKLKPVTYRFADQPDYGKNTVRPIKSDGHESGFLAQEVMQVLPNSVAIDEDNRYLVNYISIIPVLVGAVQELSVRVEALEKELTELKRK